MADTEMKETFLYDYLTEKYSLFYGYKSEDDRVVSLMTFIYSQRRIGDLPLENLTIRIDIKVILDLKNNKAFIDLNLFAMKPSKTKDRSSIGIESVSRRPKKTIKAKLNQKDQLKSVDKLYKKILKEVTKKAISVTWKSFGDDFASMDGPLNLNFYYLALKTIKGYISNTSSDEIFSVKDFSESKRKDLLESSQFMVKEFYKLFNRNLPSGCLPTEDSNSLLKDAKQTYYQGLEEIKEN